MYSLFNSLIIASPNAVIVLSTIIIGQMTGKKVSQDRYMPPSYKGIIEIESNNYFP
jgi:hypothetical protein